MENSKPSLFKNCLEINFGFLNYCQMSFCYRHITWSTFKKKADVIKNANYFTQSLTGNINLDALNSNMNLRHKSRFFPNLLECLISNATLTIYENILWTRTANIKNNKYNVICRTQCKSETSLLITGYGFHLGVYWPFFFIPPATGCQS